MLVIMFAFANSFYLIGRNQLEFEGHEAEYADFGGAMKYIYLTALGEFGIEDYEGKGEGKYRGILWFLFILATFMLLVHLLNMLIAIMGETFSEMTANEEVQKAKSHLSFVMDNWWIDPIKGKNKIRYIIAAQMKDEDDEAYEILDELQRSQKSLQTLVTVNFEKINEKINDLASRNQ